MLEADPLERAPRPWIDGEAGRALLDLARTDPDPAGVPSEYAKGMQITAPKVVPGVSKAAVERLRALGYAE